MESLKNRFELFTNTSTKDNSNQNGNVYSANFIIDKQNKKSNLINLIELKN